MPRYVRRRYSSSSRRTVPGSTRRVKAGPSRDYPVLTRPRLTRKLVHVIPAFQTSPDRVWANSGNNATWPALGHINPIALGDGINMRTGNRVWMRNLILCGQFLASENGTVGSTCARLALIYDRRPASTIPQTTTIFDDDHQASFPTLNNRDRFDILYNRLVDFNKTPVVETGGLRFYQTNMRCFRLVIPINRRIVLAANAATGVLSEIITGALYLSLFNEDAPAATNASIKFFMRLTYEDYA